MKILIVSQYYWPESFVINQLASQLESQGHHIVVLTGKPNYPDGVVFLNYRQAGIQHEQHDGVEVIRIPVRPRKSGKGKDLTLNYLSFVVSGLLRFPRLVKGRKFDVIFVFAPSPITSVIPAIFLKYIKKTHLAIWVQDLWPESLSATGSVKNEFILKMVGYLVKAIYACSDTLLVQSQAFFHPIGMLAKKEKIQYFPNPIDDMQGKMTSDKDNLLPEALKNCLETHFCLVFAGNIGKAQSIETIIAAAANWKNRADIKFVFVGKGSMLQWAQQKIVELQLENVVFAGSFPMTVMPSIFSRADALLVSLNADDIFSYTIPSKIQAYMNAGRPIIGSINGEAAKIINEAGAGLTCPAANVDGLTDCVEQIVTMSKAERENLGLAGRKYFLENFEMNSQCENLVKILVKRISRGRVN